MHTFSPTSCSLDNQVRFPSTQRVTGCYPCPHVAMSRARHLSHRRRNGREAVLSLRNPCTIRSTALVVTCQGTADRSEERKPRTRFFQAPRHEILETCVVGVTFDNRQEIVASLRTGEPLLLAREPENTFDVNAVAVTTLSGDTVGYIRKDLTYEFQADVTVGRVISTGKTETGFYGVKLACTPGRVSLYVDLIPRSLRGTNLSAELPTSEWNRLRKTQYRKAGHRCQVCGGVGERWPVECHERWSRNPSTRTLHLRGLLALCPMCHKVKHLSRASNQGESSVLAQRHLATINGWTVEQTTSYLEQVMRTLEEDNEHVWRVDTSWLVDRKSA
mmetsp:Transcript_21198/g.46504  ORF Transcript_21198/g.46504 Transcript_21198/m.46504 type:complete len:332 (-) Transcript_21198:570-1565(-)